MRTDYGYIDEKGNLVLPAERVIFKSCGLEYKKSVSYGLKLRH